MGKKGTKRKTQWRTLSITEQDEINTAAAAISSKGNYNNGINIDEASSVDDNYKYSGTNYSYLKRKSSSFNSSSNLNNNNNNYNINIYHKNRNEYRNSDSNLNSYYNSNKQHNNNDTTINNSNITTTANRTNNTTPTDPNYHYNSNNHNYNTSLSRYSYRRRPYSMQQNGGISTGSSSSSSKYYSSYGAGRATSRANRSYNDTTNAISNKENDYPKPCFNEDEYTRITTPRQDVIFKKGYFSRPRPYLSSNTDTNTTSSAAASVVSNEESLSATSVPSSLSPEQCSSSQSDSIPDPEHTLMYSYVDQSGFVYVNPYMPNGFDQYSGQMFMMPYGYSPYNIYPPDLNTPPLNETEIEENGNEEEKDETDITDSDEKKISDNLSNKDKLNDNETNKLNENSKSDLDNCDSVDDTSNTEESSIEPKDDTVKNTDEGYINEHYTNINNHCQPNFMNYGGFGGQYYPPMFYPLNMYGAPPIMPIIGGPGYDVPLNIVEQNDDEDGDDSDQSTNCTQANRNRSRRDIQHTHRNSTGATTTDYSEDECSNNDEVKESQSIGETTVKQQATIQEDKQILLSENESCDIKLVDDVDKTKDEEICSSITQETDNKQIKFNANVEEFKPRNVSDTLNNKPHLNVNVKEFLPRSYQTDSSSPSLDHHDTVIDVTKTRKKLESQSTLQNKEISLENPHTVCVKSEKDSIQQQEITIKKANESIIKPKMNELTLAEKIKLSLAEENKKKLQQYSTAKEDENIRKEYSRASPREAAKKNINKDGRKLDKSESKFNKKKPTKQENRVQLPESPSKNNISSATELNKPNNVLSYAQMVNKDLNTKSSSQSSKSITAPHENNPANNNITNNNNQSTKDIDDDIDIQILLKSLDAADNLTAAKENISWQTVKPKGKRGKNYKDGEFEESEQEHLSTCDQEADDPVEIAKKTKLLGNENKKKQITVEESVKTEETSPIPIEEQTMNQEEIVNTPTVNTMEKKKSKSKNKKSPSSSLKKTSKTSKSNKVDAKNETESNNAEKTDKNDEDASNLARRLFEEIDLSLKTTQKESVDDDDDLILGEIYSPNSNLMSKSFGRNSLDMMNGGFDYKYKNTSILKEEEEMVLNVIKSLSSNSSSASPIGGNCSSGSKNSFNIFNASFMEGMGITTQKTNDLPDAVLKKTSTTENLEKVIENNDKQNPKLSTSQKKHNKLGISKKGGKNLDKLEVKNKVGKNMNHSSDQVDTEIVEFSSPETNATENINDSSEYIKNCIQESFKWIEKSNIPKFTKTIEEHLTKSEEIENKEMEVDNELENIKENVTNVAEEQSEIKFNKNNTNNAKIEQACEQIVEEALAEECIAAGINNISHVTADDIQENSSTDNEMFDKPAEEVILNEDSIKIDQQTVDESSIKEQIIESKQLEMELTKCDEIEVTSLDSFNSELSTEDQSNNKVENCQICEESDSDECTAMPEGSLIENVSLEVPPENISQCNGHSVLDSMKNDEDNELPNCQNNEEKDFDVCFENCIENFVEEIASSEVSNTKTCNTNENQTNNYSKKVNGFHNDEDIDTNHQDIKIQTNGFHEKIAQSDKISEHKVEPKQIENLSSAILQKDTFETVPSSIEINTLITPLNIPETKHYINGDISITSATEAPTFDEKSSQLSESYDDCEQRKFERESSTSSSTSLEIQLKLLQEQLMKFDEISIKPVETNNQTEEEYTENLSINHNGCEQNQNTTITTSHSCIDERICNPKNLTQINLDLENCCDNPKVTIEMMTTATRTTPLVPQPSSPDLTKKSLFFPQNKTESESLEKFPLTQAVKLWLNSESKENSPEPLLRIPKDPMLCSLIKSSISQQSLDQYNNYDNDYDIEGDDDNDDTWSTSDEDEITNKNVLINDSKLNGDVIKNGVIKKQLKNSKNLKSNPLHVSSVNKQSSSIITSTPLDNDSDYNSDSQQRYDDDNTCERVAKNLSDLVQQQQNQLTKCDLLEYWDDEFIDNPKKWLNPKQLNNIDYNEKNKKQQCINYDSNESVLSSGCPSTSSQSDLNNLLPYDSVYGKTIDYNQLLANNNYEFLSNNIINLNNINNNIDDENNVTENDNDDDDDDDHNKFNQKNFNNDTLLNKNNNNNNNFNNNFDNNINNNNKNNCLKPPEVCCILM